MPLALSGFWPPYFSGCSTDDLRRHRNHRHPHCAHVMDRPRDSPEEIARLLKLPKLELARMVIEREQTLLRAERELKELAARMILNARIVPPLV